MLLYKVIPVPLEPAEKALNRLAREGWRLVAVDADNLYLEKTKRNSKPKRKT